MTVDKSQKPKEPMFERDNFEIYVAGLLGGLIVFYGSEYLVFKSYLAMFLFLPPAMGLPLIILAIWRNDGDLSGDYRVCFFLLYIYIGGPAFTMVALATVLFIPFILAYKLISGRPLVGRPGNPDT